MKGLSEQEWAAFVCPIREETDRKPTVFIRMLRSLGQLLWILLLAVFSMVGVMTVYRLHDVERFFVRHEYRLRGAAIQHSTRVRRDFARWLRRLLEPLGQFLSIFSYLRATRSAPPGARVPLRTVIFVVFKKLLYPLGRLVVTILNIAAPAAGVWFLIITIQNSFRDSYGLQVFYNGALVGNVRSESQYNEALRRMNERMIDGGPRDAGTASFSVIRTDQYTDPETMANRMIQHSGLDLFEGYGLYVDGDFLGALEDCTLLLDDLSARLDAAKTGALAESISFNRRFSLQAGFYPTASKTETERIISRFNTQLAAEKTYTVQEGDTPIGIASLNGITVDELTRLNPDILTSLFVGDQVTIAHSVPYLRILSRRAEVTTEDIPFTTETSVDEDELMGYYKVEVEGENGKRRVTSMVTYLDDEPIESEMIDSEVLTDPLPRQIIVGGRRPAASTTSGYDTTNDILEGLGGETYIWPVDGGRIYMPIWGYYGHTGNDISNIPAGTTIRAAASGVVIYSGYTTWGYGRHIIIQHPNGTQTLYAHNSANYVSVGDEVAQGQAIGAVGMTGNATGNHCHFEIRQNGQYLDARQFIGSVCPR